MGEMITAGVTAARRLGPPGRAVIAAQLDLLPPADRYVTGGARGGDAYAGWWLVRNRPAAQHVVVVPADKSQVDPWWLRVDEAVTFILMPAGTSYADRNAEMVRQCSHMSGFPGYAEDDLRSRASGTWQTIRMAADAKKLAQWHTVEEPFTSQVLRDPATFGPTLVPEALGVQELFPGGGW